MKLFNKTTFCAIAIAMGALTVSAQKKGLLVIDIQNDYFKGGAMELVGSERAASNAQSIIELFRKNSLPVIYIQHINDYQGATFFLPNTDGNKINDAVKPSVNDKIIVKYSPNSFKETELQDYLKKSGIDKLVIVGMMTHMCVDATTRAAKDFGYDCTLIGDACATRDLLFQGQTIPAKHVQAAFLSSLQGAYAKVIDTKDFLACFAID